MITITTLAAGGEATFVSWFCIDIISIATAPRRDPSTNEDAQPGERHLRPWQNRRQRVLSLDESGTPLLGRRHQRRALFARMCLHQKGDVDVHKRSRAL